MQTAPCYVRRFDTIPACVRQMDGGIAVASTALAIRALRRAVKTNAIPDDDDVANRVARCFTALNFHCQTPLKNATFDLFCSDKCQLATVNANRHWLIVTVLQATACIFRQF